MSRYYIVRLLILYFFINNAFAICTGILVNPITSICWECFFPLSIGSMQVIPSTKPDTLNFPSPICVCPKGGVPLPGISMGLWEPVGLIDVVKEPFCFSNLGGLNLGGGITKAGAGTQHEAENVEKHSFHYVHYYKYPVTLLLNIALDAACLEISNFDIAYMSEVDPIWRSDELALIMNPEAMVFGNLIAQAACSADCVKASIGTAFDSLFWCAGCHGGIYPFTGRGLHSNTVQNSVLMAEKTLFRMHRQLQLMNTSGPESICFPTPAPIIKKSQYRTQIVNPVPSVVPFLGCQPFGRTTTLYESGRIVPGVGENFGYLIWRKRNCCVL